MESERIGRNLATLCQVYKSHDFLEWDSNIEELLRTTDHLIESLSELSLYGLEYWRDCLFENVNFFSHDIPGEQEEGCIIIEQKMREIYVAILLEIPYAKGENIS